jgi:hypothetical protein
MTKTLNQIFFCYPPPKSQYFVQQHWESEYFNRKNKKKHKHDQIEDEKHVLLDCPLYADLRERLFNEVKRSNVHFIIASLLYIYQIKNLLTVL